MRKPQTVKTLEDLGRVQLSKSFFIVVTSFIPYYERTQDWTALAWWIHDHIDAYTEMTFFPKYAAFNISWRENPNISKAIYSYL